MTSRPYPTCEGTGEIIPDPCDNCGGDDRVRVRCNLTVNVLAGIPDGVRIRMAGQGEVDPGGDPAGDLYVEVAMGPHPVFEREGDGLHFSVQVPMVDIVLGTEFEVDNLLDEPMTIKIDSGTQPAEQIRLSDKDVSHLHGESNSDMIAHVNAIVPTKLDRKPRELLEKLHEYYDDDAKVADSSERRGFFSRFRRR